MKKSHSYNLTYKVCIIIEHFLGGIQFLRCFLYIDRIVIIFQLSTVYRMMKVLGCGVAFLAA